MRRLEFVAHSVDAYTKAVAAAVARGVTALRLPTMGELGRTLAIVLAAQFPALPIDADEINDEPARPAERQGDDGTGRLDLLCDPDEERLTGQLMTYLDRPDADVVAPITDRFWNRRSLFLVSIPKAGTHLLTELVRAFGYREGGECPATEPVPGAWHFLEFTNSHTAAPDFFIDSVRRAAHGNRLHPFPFHPTLFIYRNPLDIVVSEASYFHEDGATPFAGYLSHLTDEERLVRLVDDKWLLGSIRDRVGKFAAWLELGSVIPVSYEELVGSPGQGSDAAQQDLIWSLMLRLQVPGIPGDFAAQVYNPNSPTFRTGQIGSHRQRFSPAAWEKFRALPQDFMDVFGYASAPAEGPWLPCRSAEFRGRRPIYSRADTGERAFIVRRNFLGHHIYRHRSRFFALPIGGGETVRNPILEANDQATVEFLVHSKLFLETSGLASLVPPQRAGRSRT